MGKIDLHLTVYLRENMGQLDGTLAKNIPQAKLF